MLERAIEDFWQTHPCGEQFGGVKDEYLAFFDRYDAFRYKLERHIPACLDALDISGKRVLEIGLGQGADSEQLIRRGAIWTGLDLTSEACKRVETRLRLKSLPFQKVVKGTVTELPFPNDSFDLVFSHGVLHHVPEIKRASKEIARVSPELVAMLYARHSLNYWTIATVRRLGLLVMYLTGKSPDRPIYKRHLELIREHGVGYLRMKNFIHRSTDGPDNPYSKVYSVREARRDFPDFRIVDAFKKFMHAPPLPVHSVPLGGLLGWHLWVRMVRPSAETA